MKPVAILPGGEAAGADKSWGQRNTCDDPDEELGESGGQPGGPNARKELEGTGIQQASGMGNTSPTSPVRGATAPLTMEVRRPLGWTTGGLRDSRRRWTEAMRMKLDAIAVAEAVRNG